MRIVPSSQIQPKPLATSREGQGGEGARYPLRAIAEQAVAAFDPQAPPASGPIEVIDLFCGCGGLAAGFEAIGRSINSFRLAGAADLDPHAADTFDRNLPVRVRREDLAVVAASDDNIDNFLSSLGLVSGAPKVLIGGPPCQGFSAHGKRLRRESDERNHLVDAFARIARRLNPDFIVMENVPELLAHKYLDRFQSLKKLLDPDYIVRARIHNLAGFGVPQARFRALVLASPRPFRMPDPFLTDSADYRTVRSAIGHLPPIGPRSPSPDDPMHACTRHRASTVATIRQIPKDGGSRPPGVGPKCLDRVDGYRDVYGRMFWDRPANTITGYSRNPASGRYVHPEQDRGLSIREAALLQAFPSSWMFEGPFDDRFQQIGNAVPPQFAAHLAAHILTELSRDPNEVVEMNTDGDVLEPTSNSFSSSIPGRKHTKRLK